MNRHRKKLEQFATGDKPLNRAIAWALAEIDRLEPPWAARPVVPGWHWIKDGHGVWDAPKYVSFYGEDNTDPYIDRFMINDTMQFSGPIPYPDRG